MANLLNKMLDFLLGKLKIPMKNTMTMKILKKLIRLKAEKLHMAKETRVKF